nr:uncharacterized protein LOC108948475 [Nicotiana tomentosiformis]
MLAPLSVKEIQEGNVANTVLLAQQNKNEVVNQYTRKKKRDSIGFDGPSFVILTPTPPTTQDGVDYQDDEISKERSGGQSQDIENTQGTSISEIVCKCIEGTYDISTPLSLTDNIGSQKNASQDNDLTGMILTVAKESCELAIEEHGEQLQDKENASNMSAPLSIKEI